MKKTFILLTELLILMIAGCTTDTAPYTFDVRYLADKTDTLSLTLKADDITAPLSLPENSFKGMSVTTSTISDIDVNPSLTASIPDGNRATDVADMRTAQVTQFSVKVQRLLDAVQSTATCPRSIIYRGVARQLNSLAVSLSPHRYCIVNSNLYEHAEVDMYDAHTLSMLYTKPDSICKQFERQVHLSNLKGIEVWLLYRPSNYEDNAKFMQVARLYTAMLESHGAIVHIAQTFSI